MTRQSTMSFKIHAMPHTAPKNVACPANDAARAPTKLRIRWSGHVHESEHGPPTHVVLHT